MRDLFSACFWNFRYSVYRQLWHSSVDGQLLARKIVRFCTHNFRTIGLNAFEATSTSSPTLSVSKNLKGDAVADYSSPINKSDHVGELKTSCLS
jgi:hypothetical protein